MRQVQLGELTTSEYIFGGAAIGGVGSAPSRVGLGMKTDEALERLDEGYELGIRGIDTANSFAVGESERVIGRWREERERGDVLIATKVGNVVERGQDEVDLSAGHIERQLTLSLSRLGSIDIYLTHGTDRRAPLEETVTAFAAAIDSEQIRAWGCSNVTVREAEAWLLAADRAGLPRPVLMQNTFSLVAQRDARDLLPLLAAEGVAFAAFSTLAGGILSDRLLGGDPDELPSPVDGTRLAIAPAMYRDAFTLDTLARVRSLRSLARDLDVSTATLALAWVRAHPEVTAAIVSPRRTAQWDDLTESLALDLDDDVFERAAALFA
jgi:aryl-alcohol dehydrogenase-like predicted oxidoreductase